MYRAPGKGLYVVVRNFCLALPGCCLAKHAYLSGASVLLNCSDLIWLAEVMMLASLRKIHCAQRGSRTKVEKVALLSLTKREREREREEAKRPKRKAP